MNEQGQENENEPHAAPRLMAPLNALYHRTVHVPPEVDQSILAAARKHLRSHRTKSRAVPVPHWLAAAAAVAAAILLAGLWLLTHRASLVVAREDIDHNGRIDILDAFALARRINSGATTRMQFDFNGDGVVDGKDIDAIAARAVKLEPRKG